MGRRPTRRHRRAPQQRRSRATVDALLAATETVLEREGYAGTTTDRIAAEAGVAVGTLYSYFRDRDELLLAMVHRMFAEVTAEIAPALDAWPTRPFAAGLAELLRAVLRALSGRREVSRILLGHVAGVLDFPEVTAIRAQVQGIYDVAVAATLPDAAPARRQLVTMVLANAVEGVILAAISREPQVDDDAVVAEIVRLVESYLAAAGAGGPI